MKHRPGGIVPLALLGFALLPAAPLEAQDCTGVTPVAGAALSSVPIAGGLPGRPLLVTAPPGDLNRLFIVEQAGFVRIKRRGDPAGTWSTFLDLSGIVQATPTLDEMGLLGLAFDPDYASTGTFYVDYTEGPLGGPWFTVVARYRVSGDPGVADPGSEVRLLRFQQPQTNHNGGQLQFGSDGYLYISAGDGGGSGDQHGTCGNGQSRGTLLGKILRLDVRGVAPSSRPPDCGGPTAPYAIPSDNPFATGPGGDCDEIWEYGLRNPWRSGFDAANGDLYIADVGQNCWEEIDYVPAPATGGRNFGWRMMEANHCYNNATPLKCDPTPATCTGVPPCNDPSFTYPIAEYGHGSGCSITGGFVYRGCLMPDFSGVYFYGDYCSGFIKSLRVVGGVATEPADWTVELNAGGTLSNSLTGFGVDAGREPYFIDRKGTVSRILPAFTLLEVSGRNTVSPLLLSVAPGAWVWQDLSYDLMAPVDHYRVYRGTPGGLFTCVFTTQAPRWDGGDPAQPGPGQLFAYVVTAVSATGQETVGGDPPVSLSPGNCP